MVTNTAINSGLSRNWRRGALIVSLAVALAFGAKNAAAQAVYQCPEASPPGAFLITDPETPGDDTGLVGDLTADQRKNLYKAFRQSKSFIPTQPIDCGFFGEDEDRYVDVRNPRITVTENFLSGINAWHQGSGDLVVYAHSVDPEYPHDPLHFSPLDHGRYAVRTSGDGEGFIGEESHGIWADHSGEGRVGIDFRDLSLSTAGGTFAVGLYASQQGSFVWEDGAARRAKGAVIINVIETERDRPNRARPLIGTRGEQSDAIRAEYTRAAAYGNVVVTVEGYTIATGGIVPPGPQIPNWELPCGTEGNPCSGGRIWTRLIPALTGNEARGIYALHEGHGDIRVDVTDSHILTWGVAAHGIFADHKGKTETITNLDMTTEVRTGGGKVKIEVTDGEIRTAGADSIGIYGHHKGSEVGDDGGVDIDATGVTIATAGHEAHGILAWIRPTLEDADSDGEVDDPIAGTGRGDIAIDLTGSSVATEGKEAFAVWAKHENEGDITIAVGADVTIATGATVTFAAGQTVATRADAYGVFAEHTGAAGDVEVTIAAGATIATKGRDSQGIRAQLGGNGDLTVDSAGDVTTQGANAEGVRALHGGTGRFAISMTSGTIETTGEVAHGIFASRSGAGDVSVTVSGGSVDAKEISSAGVLVRGSDAIVVTVGRGASVAGGHVGIQIGDAAADETVPTHTIQVDGMVRSSAGAGISMLNGGEVTVSSTGKVIADSGFGIISEGSNDLTATIAGMVKGDIRTMGTGTLTISVPEGGTVTGTVHDPVGLSTVVGSIGRLLYSSGATVTVARTGALTGVEVDGRTEALRSEAGDLDLTVAGMVVGDVFGLGAGEHTVTIANGGTVTGTVDLAASTVTVHGTAGWVRFANGGTATVGSTGSITGDIISLGDRRARITTEPGSTVAGNIEVNGAGSWVTVGGTVKGYAKFGLDGALTIGQDGKVEGGVPDTGAVVYVMIERKPGETRDEARKRALPNSENPNLVFDGEAEDRYRVYEDRYRVYEALPSVLLAMNRLSEFRDRMAAPRDSRGAWGRLETTGGTWKTDTSTAGSAYTHRKRSATAGVDVSVGEDILLGVSVHHRSGSATVARGGEIKVSGNGFGISGTWSRDDVYVDIAATATRYGSSLSSRLRGALRQNASAHGHALGVEVGHRVASLPGDMVLTPRIGLVHSRISMSAFSDSVSENVGRVSLNDGRSLRARVGASLETGPIEGGANRVFGSLDLERETSDETSVTVSGTELTATGRKTWLRLGIGGVHSWGGLHTLRGTADYATGGGGAHEYGAGLELKLRF